MCRKHTQKILKRIAYVNYIFINGFLSIHYFSKVFTFYNNGNVRVSIFYGCHKWKSFLPKKSNIFFFIVIFCIFKTIHFKFIPRERIFRIV